MKLKHQFSGSQGNGRFFVSNNVGGARIEVAPRRTPIVARFRAAYEFVVPIGYEDETGFHYGEQPRPE